MTTREFLNSQSGIRQTNSSEYDAAMQKYTPVNQQAVHSHVLTPLLIGFIVSVVLTLMALAAMITYWEVNTFILSMVFGGSFLFIFLRRIGVADRVLWAIEEMFGTDIDGDGEVGYAPRSVTVNTKNGSRDVAVSDQPEKLYNADWAEVATAVLANGGRVSRRGIYNNCKLSQSKAQLAVALLEKGYSKNGEINERGWDWLVSHLPDNKTCKIERPTAPPTSTPPTLLDGG